jgi:hypothetical protein
MLAGILDGFDNWSARTYEGRKPTFTIVVDFEDKQVVDKHYPSILDVLTETFLPRSRMASKAGFSFPRRARLSITFLFWKAS